ncbi:MAG: hypothetical protein M1825_004101 [Sarcosagium campestre]|nr:MAG: hypothetical protein M1825_004101 [Sarcosagium campestre]
MSESHVLTQGAPEARKVWTTLITNTKYLSGLLTLDYTLKKYRSKYPLVALYTDTFEPEGHKALEARGIPKRHVEYLLPSTHKDFSNDPRFYDCWSKLTPFSLTQYERVVQLDSDMIVLQNMDELMELELDPPTSGGQGNKVFAASHACVCNPLNKPHYPRDWVPANCAFTSQHDAPDLAQTQGPSPTSGLGICNGGLQVVNPSKEIYNLILAQLNDSDVVTKADFADQSLLSDLFRGRWVALPYTYNALKSLRWVHKEIWRDGQVKNLHYILSPKPWDESPDALSAETAKWWFPANEERLAEENVKGIQDGF